MIKISPSFSPIILFPHTGFILFVALITIWPDVIYLILVVILVSVNKMSMHCYVCSTLSFFFFSFLLKIHLFLASGIPCSWYFLHLSQPNFRPSIPQLQQNDTGQRDGETGKIWKIFLQLRGRQKGYQENWRCRQSTGASQRLELQVGVLLGETKKLHVQCWF